MLKFAIGYALIVSLLLVVFRVFLVQIYTTDTDVIQLASALLLLIAVYQLVDDTQAVMIGSLRGYKDTTLPMVFSLLILGTGPALGLSLSERLFHRRGLGCLRLLAWNHGRAGCRCRYGRLSAAQSQRRRGENSPHVITYRINDGITRARPRSGPLPR